MEKNLREIFNRIEGLDPKSIEFLIQALTRSNQPGFDYLEFKLSLGRLAEMNIPQETAFKSAFATASTVGLTKEILMNTAKHYTQVLVREKEQFDLALGNQLKIRVDSKRKEIENLKAQIAQWKVQIEKLQNQIAKAQATISDADSLIQEEMDKIQATKNNFEKTYQAILEQVELDIKNIQRFI